LTLSLVEDLLQVDAGHWIDPDGHLGQVLADGRIFGNQFQLLGFDFVLAVEQGLRTEVLDLPLFFQFPAAGAEAEHQVALEFAGLAEGGYLIGIAAFE